MRPSPKYREADRYKDQDRALVIMLTKCPNYTPFGSPVNNLRSGRTKGCLPLDLGVELPDVGDIHSRTLVYRFQPGWLSGLRRGYHIGEADVFKLSSRDA